MLALAGGNVDDVTAEILAEAFRQGDRLPSTCCGRRLTSWRFGLETSLICSNPT